MSQPKRASMFGGTSSKTTEKSEETILKEQIAQQSEQLRSQNELCAALQKKVASQDSEISKLREATRAIPDLIAEVEKLKTIVSPDSKKNFEEKLEVN